MRILAISAYYPPYCYGGFEIRVSNILDALAAHGHELCVLTTQPDPTMKSSTDGFCLSRATRIARGIPQDCVFLTALLHTA